MRTGCWKFCRGAFSRMDCGAGATGEPLRPPPITFGAALERFPSNLCQPPFELLFTTPFEAAGALL
jgi:hypothetical protein